MQKALRLRTSAARTSPARRAGAGPAREGGAGCSQLRGEPGRP